jgi:RNA recognition motif-containing protein
MSPSSLKRKRAPSPQPVEDTPVLSHAAKRKQKKALSGEPATVSKKEKEEEDDSAPVKRQNSIWVGNLSYKTTPESLRRFFDGVGEITRVHLPTKPGKAAPGESARRENRGCGYLYCSLYRSLFYDHRAALPMWTLLHRRLRRLLS